MVGFFALQFSVRETSQPPKSCGKDPLAEDQVSQNPSMNVEGS